jgi:chorismate mutase
MDIPGWRKQIDEIDLKLVALLNQRAAAAIEIGKLKRNTELPVYEPDREKQVFESVGAANSGPLSDAEIHDIYERVIDVMRSLQKHEIERGKEKAERP